MLSLWWNLYNQRYDVSGAINPIKILSDYRNDISAEFILASFSQLSLQKWFIVTSIQGKFSAST